MTRRRKWTSFNCRKLSSTRSEEISSYVLLLSLIVKLVPDYYSVSLLVSRSLIHDRSLLLYSSP